MNNSMWKLLVVVLALWIPAAYGGNIAITNFTNSDVAGHGNYDLAGFDFSNSAAIDVTALGMYVSGTNLSDSHTIGIWDLSGDLVFDAAVSAGATPDASGFTWVNLTSEEVLPVGEWFIGVQYNAGSADGMYDGYGSITMASGLTFDNAAVYYNNVPISLTDPAGNGDGLYTEGLPRDSYIGPNFAFASVPEPGTLGLVLLGAAGLALLHGRRALIAKRFRIFGTAR
jgi:hypothetical protein